MSKGSDLLDKGSADNVGKGPDLHGEGSGDAGTSDAAAAEAEEQSAKPKVKSFVKALQPKPPGSYQKKRETGEERELRLEREANLALVKKQKGAPREAAPRTASLQRAW